MSRLDWLIPLSLGLAAGFALGLAYFGGLWWTTRRIVSASGNPILSAGSFVGRLALLALGLVLMASVEPFMLLGSLPGLLAARVTWTRSINRQASSLPLTGFRARRSEG